MKEDTVGSLRIELNKARREASRLDLKRKEQLEARLGVQDKGYCWEYLLDLVSSHVACTKAKQDRDYWARHGFPADRMKDVER